MSFFLVLVSIVAIGLIGFSLAVNAPLHSIRRNLQPDQAQG